MRATIRKRSNSARFYCCSLRFPCLSLPLSAFLFSLFPGDPSILPLNLCTHVILNDNPILRT